MAEHVDRKRQKTDDSDLTDVCGYIHNVSPVKISEKNNAYFTCKLQSESDVSEVVCLTPEKWKSFQRAEKEDSAVFVKNVRCQLENRRQKLFTNYKTIISNVTEPLGFEKRQQLNEEIQIQSITIADVFVKPLDLCGFYSLSGKVISIGKPIEIMIFGSRKNCQNVAVTDGTYKLNISMYGSLIDGVEKGKSYQFHNVALRKINNINKLTVRKQTIIKETEFQLLGDTYDVGKNDTDSEHISIDVNGVKCELKVKCPCCGHDVNYGQVKHVATVRCSKCDMLAKTSKLVAVMTTRIDGIQANGVNQKLTIHNFAMKEFVVKVNKEHLLTDPKGLEEYIIKQNGKMGVVLNESNVKEITFDPVVD
ncbi:hypothetical protein LOTGIDRAFT_157140 [Lottia gigantea]|uniref:Uncharacterized protein n=1 Tax=Lottia gigantea TaxID=225164 RepID=V4AWV8_LOTGI|nr:hypothetical protein LOTGIDRAFT_157140 [Lottia gigantea]ESP02003.1 hypothetical protein LOTGIDRAFT_157140 [Lottia gigantea]